MTLKLYYTAPYQIEFDANIISSVQENGYYKNARKKQKRPCSNDRPDIDMSAWRTMVDGTGAEGRQYRTTGQGY